MYGRSSTSLSSLLTFAIVSFTRYSLWPWILIYLYSRKYESWAQVVVAYGLLISSLNLGIYLGQLTAAQCRQLSRAFYILVFTALTSAYSSIAFVSRFPLTVVLFWVVGFMGSILMVNGEGGADKKASSLLSSWQHKEQDLDSSLHNQRTLVVFIFSTLIAGFLYDSRPHIDFPCYNLSILLTVACLGMTAYRIIRKSRSKKQHGQHHHHSKHQPRKATNRLAGVNGLDMSSFEDKGEVKAVEVQGDVPLNFLSACRGDLAKARLNYGKMLAWRQLYHVDEIFDIPQPTFHDIIKYYPHAIHGYSLDGCLVVYEILGKGKPNELKATGVSIDDIVWHFNLRNELIFNRLANVEKVTEVSRNCAPGVITPTPFPYNAESGALKTPIPRMMTVIDVEGISISSVTTEVISFIKKSGEIIDNYYPEQVARLVICRAPRWFSTIWTIIARVLPETVQKKVDILYDAKGLDKYIHPSQRPKEYGGTDVDLGQGEGHLAFLKLAKDWKLDELQASQEDGIERKDSAGKLSRQVSASSRTGSEVEGIAAGSNTPFARGKGMLTWLSSRFRKPQSAYLGEKNTYRYNEGTGKWETELDLESSKSAAGRAESIEESDTSSDDDDQDIPTPLPRTPSFDVRDSRRGAGRRKKKMSKEQLEEHGLVLAIHAAHYASKYAKMSGSDAAMSPHGFNANQFSSNANLANMGSMPSSANLNSMEYGNLRPTSMSSMMLSNLDSNDTNNADSNKDNNTNTTSNNSGNMSLIGSSKLSSYIFLLVASIFILITNCHIMLITLLPVWLTAPLKSGGLGYGVRDLGLLGSFCGLMVLHAQILLGGKFEHVLKASPVRALRIGCGIATLVLFLLPMYVRHYTIPLEDILHHHHDAARNDAGIGIHHSAHHGSSFYHFVEEDVRVYLSYLLPSLSITSLLVQSFLISTLICASFVCRKASGMLLHLILGTSFHSPVMIRYALHAVGDVTGPFLSAVVYAIIYGSRLKYPMNSSFFLAFIACGSLLAYILSLYIVVQFRGDYGVMSDHQELKALLWDEDQGTGQNNSNATNGDDSSDEEIGAASSNGGAGSKHGTKGLHQRFGTPSGGSSDGSGSSVKGGKPGIKLSKDGIAECVARPPEESLLYIPLGDISLLFSSMTHGYGSKLYNLKDDFKDVDKEEQNTK